MPLRPCLLSLACLTLVAQKPEALERKALALHQRLLTVDTHCDTPMRLGATWDVGQRHEPGKPNAGCQDLPRMKEGNLSASFFAVFIGQGPRTEEGHAKAKTQALATFDALDAMHQAYPALCAPARKAEDALAIRKSGRQAIFLGLENGYPVGHSVDNVDLFYRRGARYITLSHSSDNDLCDSSTDLKDPEDRGLSALGTQVVKRMNDLGMMVDVSHISEKSFYDVLKASRAPVLASHSCARALCDHPRNLRDEQLRALKANGGVIQICFVSEFVKAAPQNSERQTARRALREKVKGWGGWEALTPAQMAEAERDQEAMDAKYAADLATVKDLVDHIDHVVKVIGVDHVGIGTDFDGGGGLRDCRDVTQLSTITVELVRRGYSEQAIAKIWGGNALRVMAAVEQAAARKG